MSLLCVLANLQLVNKFVNFTKLQQVTNHACCNLSFADLLQLVEITCSKPVDNDSFDNQLETSLLTTCNNFLLDVNKPAAPHNSPYSNSRKTALLRDLNTKHRRQPPYRPMSELSLSPSSD